MGLWGGVQETPGQGLVGIGCTVVNKRKEKRQIIVLMELKLKREEEWGEKLILGSITFWDKLIKNEHVTYIYACLKQNC